MMPSRSRRTVLVAVAAAASAITAGSGLASPGGHDAGGTAQQQTCPVPVAGADPDTVTLSGPASLWPPNGRYVDYTLTASETAGEAGDHAPHGVTITYSVSTAGGSAAQASPPAGTEKGDFSVPVHFQLRAARSGNGGAVTYVINWTASFDSGLHPCSSTGTGEHPFTVTVPHDRRS